MKHKMILTALVLGGLAASSPAMAGGWGGKKPGWSSTSSTSSTSTTSTSSTSSTSGGTKVPEPGMLGILGLGLMGLGYARYRRKSV